MPKNTKNSVPSLRKQNIARQFAQADDYNSHAHIQNKICQLLSDKTVKNTCESVLEIGAGQGLLTKKLAHIVTAKSWLINELCPQNHAHLQPTIPTAEFYFGDAEGLDFLDITVNSHQNSHQNSKQQFKQNDERESHLNIQKKFDLIVSANTVQWFDKPLGFIEDALNYLKPNGQLLFNSFTPNNFKQIKQLTGQGLMYPSNQEWQNIINECLVHESNKIMSEGISGQRNSTSMYKPSNVQITTHTYDAYFDTPYDVLRHIKNTGVAVSNDKKFLWNRESLKDFDIAYKEQFSDEQGQVILTYEALVINLIKGC